MCDSIGLMCEYFIKCVFLLWTGEISLRIRVFLPCTGADSLRIRDILLCSGAISLHIRDIQPCTGAISLRICGIPLCISAGSFRSCVSHFLWWGYFLSVFSLYFLMFLKKNVCGLCFSAFASFDLRYNRSDSF